MTYLRPLLAAVAGALALVTVPAIAQDYYSDEIIVEAPGVVRERTGRRSSSTGAPIEELRLQRVITTKDLDLRQDADVYELHRRIRAVAEDSCDEVERASQGVPLTTERQCVRAAVRDAMAQADALVYARRG